MFDLIANKLEFFYILKQFCDEKWEKFSCVKKFEIGSNAAETTFLPFHLYLWEIYQYYNNYV